MVHVKTAFLFAIFTFFSTGLKPIGGTEPMAALEVSVAPVTLSLSGPAIAAGTKMRLALETVGPDGKRYPLRDVQGTREWRLPALPLKFRVRPDPAGYAGPLKVIVNGKPAETCDAAGGRGRGIVLEKTLAARLGDGFTIRIHYTDFATEKSGDANFPYAVLMLVKNAYEILTFELGYTDGLRPGHRAIDVVLGERTGSGFLPIGGFTKNDFRRAPLFLFKKDAETKEKTPVILIPVDYRHFLSVWDRINAPPRRMPRDPLRELAGSIMHEMTHAVLHGFHENLGSTEYRVYNGDWYTEGLARFYETKAGSETGFASCGFRKRIANHMQFSRGGANYYLRWPDENFFDLRYENALFWLYFENRFGARKIVDLTRALKFLPFRAERVATARLLGAVAGVSFDRLLMDYFEWVHRGDYKRFPEARRLLRPATARSRWSNGVFRFETHSGKTAAVARVIRTDWVSRWGRARSNGTASFCAGDWTPQADLKPLGFDVQEISLEGPRVPRELVIRNLGNSPKLAVALHVHGKDGIRSFERLVGSRRELVLKDGFPDGTTKISALLANLDLQESLRYEIELR